MNRPNPKKGFTLVELSIVLVIIGLLIGGILAAQSMITTTKIQAFARQVGQFDAAVVNFTDKFGGLPGDVDPAIGGTAGNGDGIIADGTVATWTGEIANFWVMLQTSGFKSDDGSVYVTTGITTAVGLNSDRAPQGKAGTNVGIFAAGSSAATSLGGGIANGYVAAGCNKAGSAADTLACAEGFNTPDAIAIDTKLDDGVGTTGNVVGAAVPAVVSTIAPLTGAATAYDTSDMSDNLNSLVIRMGNAAGNPM